MEEEEESEEEEKGMMERSGVLDTRKEGKFGDRSPSDFRKKIKLSANERSADRMLEEDRRGEESKKNQNQDDYFANHHISCNPSGSVPPSQTDLLIMGIEDQIDSLTLTNKNEQQWALNGRKIRKQMVENLSLICSDMNKPSTSCVQPLDEKDQNFKFNTSFPSNTNSSSRRNEKGNEFNVGNSYSIDRRLSNELRKKKEAEIVKKKQGQMKKFLLESSANISNSPTKSKFT